MDTKGLPQLAGKVEAMSRRMKDKGVRYLFTDERSKEIEWSRKLIEQ